jgi:uncharacterized membrane protein (UPF0127 family)
MITIPVHTANSLFKRTKGLIGQERIEPFFLKTRFGIHTFGMKKGIDVVILDKQNRIQTVKKNLKPFRILLWNPLYDRVLELPRGFISTHHLKKGEQVKLIEQPE